MMSAEAGSMLFLIFALMFVIVLIAAFLSLIRKADQTNAYLARIVELAEQASKRTTATAEAKAEPANINGYVPPWKKK